MKMFYITLLITFMTSLSCWSQEIVNFKLTPDATFKTDEGEDFVIVSFEGKDAQEIYKLLATNINSMYNNPSKVMHGVEFSSIKIRAIGDLVYDKSIIGIESILQAYYQLEFRIKDGKVRISAPIIEQSLMLRGEFTTFKIFSKVVGDYYKKGVLKEKKKKDYLFVNSKINDIINKIIGSNNEQDW